MLRVLLIALSVGVPPQGGEEGLRPDSVLRLPEGPQLLLFTDRGASVTFLADVLAELTREEPFASVAILTPSAEASDIYFEGLAAAEISTVRRIAHQNFTFSPGVEVTEIEQVKGLEFDYVILVDVNHDRYPDAPAARRLYYKYIKIQKPRTKANNMCTQVQYITFDIK